jgi:signal transduction histidine kinase
MRAFANKVAAGELDVPLDMDKHNVFGAFTESFDLMRTELLQARENEHAAGQSKQELVASLSHDIQTPVASIQAVAELMEITATTNQRHKLSTIRKKAGQINTMVGELFQTALEDLNTLSVKVIPFPSDELEDMIIKSDYKKKAQIKEIPGCLVQADPVRLVQVIDNIIVNSYKYADTVIQVAAEMDEKGLILTLRDYGPGVEPDELQLLSRKYYRGKSVGNDNGYGLGLYIAHTLTERMGGQIECQNANPGFIVKLWLKFA